MKAKTAAQARRLEDIPNIGKSIAGDLRAIGVMEPAQCWWGGIRMSSRI